MSDTASLYFQTVVVTGVFLLLNGLPKFATDDLARFLVYLLLGMLCATWKVRLPRIPVTVSPVFAFVLIGVASFPLGQALLLGCLPALVQSLWKTKTKPTFSRSAFSVCAVASGVVFAYGPPHFLLAHGLASVPLMLAFAAVIFWLVNAGLVGGLASFVSGTPFPDVWRTLNHHLLGFYIAGGLVAALVITVDRLWGWQWGALVIPTLYLASFRYRTAVETDI
jgi:hypothetical protein